MKRYPSNFRTRNVRDSIRVLSRMKVDQIGQLREGLRRERGLREELERAGTGTERFLATTFRGVRGNDNEAVEVGRMYRARGSCHHHGNSSRSADRGAGTAGYDAVTDGGADADTNTDAGTNRDARSSNYCS